MRFSKVVLPLLLFYIFTTCGGIDITVEESPKGSCVMIIPDIQNYTNVETGIKYLNSITTYYKQCKEHIDLCLQVGDLTYNNLPEQYEIAYDYLINKFDTCDQFVFCLGNHDYGNNGRSDSRFSNFQNDKLPPVNIKMNDTGWENYVRYVSIGGERTGVLVLEFATRNQPLEWANQVISSDPNTPYIILTHVFLNRYGEIYDYTDENLLNTGSNKSYQMGDDYINDSREIFDKLIYNNTNIKMVVCGHCKTPDYINVTSETNVKGDPVYMIMVNYQHYIEGGMGYIGLLSIEGNTHRIRSYSTFNNHYGDVDISF